MHRERGGLSGRPFRMQARGSTATLRRGPPRWNARFHGEANSTDPCTQPMGYTQTLPFWQSAGLVVCSPGES